MKIRLFLIDPNDQPVYMEIIDTAALGDGAGITLDHPVTIQSLILDFSINRYGPGVNAA